MGQGDPGCQHQGGVTPIFYNVPFRVNDMLLRCIIFLGRESAVGQFLPPSSATAMEELASTPDAKARNRYAAF